MRGIKTILKGLTDQQRNDLHGHARNMVLNKNTEKLYYCYFGVLDGYLMALVSVGTLDGVCEAEMVRTYYINEAEKKIEEEHK